jgi:hypothetical protein
MENAAKKPDLNGAAFGSFLYIIICALTLAACGSLQDGGSSRVSLAPPPPQFIPGPEGLMAFAGSDPDTLIITSDRPLRYADRADVPVSGAVNAAPDDCAIKHRFDRSAAIAYNFSDNKSRLALNMGLDGTSVEKAMIRFTYKFQPLKSKKERCLYNSPVQGLVGSVINELVIRKDDTVWHELKAKGFKFWE